MKNISELSLQEVCNYIACMNKLVEEKIVIFKPNKAFIKFNYDKATRHLEKQNIEQKEEIERLNNIIKDIKSQLDYLETYSSKEDVFEDMKRRLDNIDKIIGSDKE